MSKRSLKNELAEGVDDCPEEAGGGDAGGGAGEDMSASLSAESHIVVTSAPARPAFRLLPGVSSREQPPDDAVGEQSTTQRENEATRPVDAERRPRLDQPARDELRHAGPGRRLEIVQRQPLGEPDG